MSSRRLIILLAIAAGILSACSSDSDSEPTPEPIDSALPVQTPAPAPTPAVTNTPTPMPTSAPEPTPQATPETMPTPRPTATPESAPLPEDEPAAWYIDMIADRDYDGCCIERLRVYEEGANFTSWVIAYQGDGLRLTGLMAVPRGEGPFPVAIFNHGYFPFDQYDTGYDTLREVRYMANAGYLAIAPDYRNYAGSDAGDHIFEPGYVYDVRNLIEALKEFPEADADRIGMSGHSMGGGITLQNIVSGAEIQAAVLYGTVTGDEAKRYEARITRWADSGSAGSNRAVDFSDRYGTPEESPEIYDRMSPNNYLDRVEVPVLIHHGDADTITPLEWAYNIEAGLQEAGKPVEMHVYEGAGHSFQGYYFELMMNRTLEFFDEHVRGAGTD